MDVKETPFVLIARVKVKPGEVENYLKIAEEVEKEFSKTEEGMLFHNFDADPDDPNKFVWTEVYRKSEAPALSIDLISWDKKPKLAESIEIEIYGKLATETIDTISQAWGPANIPFKHFKTTNVGYYRNSIFL